MIQRSIIDFLLDNIHCEALIYDIYKNTNIALRNTIKTFNII